jgi:prolyl-tRNA synthetase
MRSWIELAFSTIARNTASTPPSYPKRSWCRREQTWSLRVDRPLVRLVDLLGKADGWQGTNMRLSKLLTRRSGVEDRGDLLERAGYTLRIADGSHALLPLGQRVLSRISAVVRRELERADAQELAMPLLQPAELWERPLENGRTRAAAFGPQLFRVTGSDSDRFVLSPTHEEIAAVVAAACVRDARDLPAVVYQIQSRFRDQDCPPGAGLLRAREFVMADAYSFHADRASLDAGYGAIRDALCAALRRCGVTVEVVRANSGEMGGDASEELVAALPSSGTVAVHCADCGYAASTEIAEAAPLALPATASRPIEQVAAQGAQSVEEVAAALSVSAATRLTWVPLMAAGRIVLAVLPGTGPINAVKLGHALSRAGVDAFDLHVASLQELAALGASYASISLLETPKSVLVVADEAVRAGSFWLPSTRVGHFAINAQQGRDFRVDVFADLRVAQDGSACPHCGHALRAIRGIEVGHVFKLGSTFTTAFGAYSTLAGGEPQALEMGCYGLGITRLLAVIAQQTADARGLAWPERVAPFAAVLLPEPDASATRAAEALYQALGGSLGDTLLDDSDASLEDKLRGADLIGIPLQLVVSARSIELRQRVRSTSQRLAASEVGAMLRARTERMI